MGMHFGDARHQILSPAVHPHGTLRHLHLIARPNLGDLAVAYHDRLTI